MLPYLFRSALSLTALVAVYWLFLRRDTSFRLNRLYLLVSVLFSMLFPLFPLRIEPAGPSAGFALMLQPVMITPEKIAGVSGSHTSWLTVAAMIYAAGVLILFVRLAAGLGKIAMTFTGYRMPDKNHAPFSFFGLIFIGRETMNSGVARAILEHERAHARQLHSADRILMEVAVMLQWFNPAAWLAAREIKALHEYLADENVLQNGISRPEYQQMILDEAMGVRVSSLTNNFNVSLLKKRMIMMTKPRSNKWAKGKRLIALPVMLALMLMLSANKSPESPSPVREKISPDELINAAGAPQRTIQKSEKLYVAPFDTSKRVYEQVDQMPAYPGGHEAMVKFLVENVKYPEDALKKNIQGTVFVSFIVRNTGKITDVKVLKGIGSGCDEEAVRVVKLMPAWTPGKMKDKPVDVIFNLPIRFALGEKKK